MKIGSLYRFKLNQRALSDVMRLLIIFTVATLLVACGGGGGDTPTGGGGGGSGDTSAPTTPSALNAIATSANRIDLTWNASTDNVGVVGYKVYRGGTFWKSVSGTSTSETGLALNTTYCYTVSAYDAAALESAQSISDCATTTTPTSGDLDTSFGATGKITTALIPGGFAFARAIVEQPNDHKLVVAGYASAGANYDFALVRYNSDGSIDTTFGTNGIVMTPIGSGDDILTALVLQPDGKLVAAGYTVSGTIPLQTNKFALVRYNSNGSLDMDFNGTGVVVTPVGSSNLAVANALIRQIDGKLVAAGYARNSSNNFDFALVRYSMDGSLDTGFNGTGIVTADFSAGADEQAKSVVQQQDGKLVVAGTTTDTADGLGGIAVARYNSDGALDTSFNSTGLVITFGNPLGTSPNVNAIVQQADGKLVTAGYSMKNGSWAVTLVRYALDGSLDTDFNGTGVVTTAINGDHAVANALIQQADGKLVAAGYANNFNDKDFVLVRYNLNGTLDTGFHVNGIVMTGIGNSDDEANALIQQADGRLTAAGYSTRSIVEFALARYLP